MSGFTRLLTVTASTLRPPDMVSGKRGVPTSKLSSVLITPLVPVDSNTRQRLNLGTPVDIMQTFCDGNPDIEAGDDLVVSSRTHPIKYVEKWPYMGAIRLRIIVESVGVKQ